MTDYDADEIVPQRKRSERKPFIDKLLGGTGILLAGAATFFPWYAFMHQDKFVMPALFDGGQRSTQSLGGRGMSGSPLALADRDAATQSAIDELTTATVPNGEATKLETPQDALGQPFPASTGFKLLHVANGRALIEDASGMYIVRVGAVLPDNSRLATLEQRDGRWVMITSNGDVHRAEQ